MEGVDLYAVGRILGHKTPRMTQRYAHLSPGYMAAAVNKLDGFFAGTLPQLTRELEGPDIPVLRFYPAHGVKIVQLYFRRMEPVICCMK